MKIKDVASWHQFVEEVERLSELRNNYISKASMSVSELLYRGHADANWRLDTTLERLVADSITLRRYYRFVSVIKAKIESVTGLRWNIPSSADFEGWCEQQTLLPFASFPGYEYLAYLRQHGFPSPLLDWTKSPYIAAYFAMADTPRKEVEKVSVFAYLESATGIKITDITDPVIQSLGRYVVTHKRHYLQQSTYTICTRIQGASLSYANHEDVVSLNEDGQDLLWRIDIPSSQRREFLSRLEAMNINFFSLFETEDKLMEHLYISEILLADHL